MRPFRTMGRMAFWQTHRPWLLAALLSALAHWALLGLLGGQHGAPTARPQPPALRMVGAPPRKLPASRPPLARTPAAADTQLATAPVSAPAAVAPIVSAPADSAPLDTAPATAPLPDQQADGNAAALDTYYFAAEELTAKPVFLRDKGAPSPTAMPDVLPLPVLAQVFIDEQGAVIQVVLSDNFLSEPAQKFIVDSFLATQFTPGLLGALPVKSRLTIEVRLDPALPSR